MNTDFDNKLAQLTQRKMLLVAEIRAVFADVPYPGDDSITDTTHPWDEGVSDYFKGTSQEGHAARELRAHSEALSFFLPEAYHYYLPAFVIAVLEEPEAADTIYNSLICDFNSRRRTKEIVHRLSSAQRQAMIKYFEYCLDDSGEYLDDQISCAINNLKMGDNL